MAGDENQHDQRRGRARPLLGLVVLTLFGALAVTACEPSYNDGTVPVPSSVIDYEALEGSIRIDGSSTVFPITEAVAEEFSRISGARVNVGFSGTGGGLERFCRGDIDIADASRPIKQDEIDACADEGIDDIVELQVAIDALTVMVNPDNDFVDCLSVEQLHDAFRSGGAVRWSDLDPAWPDDRMVKFFPGTDSGTFDYFVEAVIDGVGEGAGHTGDGTASEDDNVLAQGIAGDSNAIGYFGFAYFQEAGQSLRPVAIDGGDGCVEPALESAIDGSYEPLSRPLFIYTRETSLREKEELLGFVDFYLRTTQQLTEEVGYVPLPEDILEAQLAKIEPFLPDPGTASPTTRRR